MPSINSRIWPAELEAYRFNPRAIPLASGQLERECPNCGGFGTLMVYVISSGPYRFPPDGGKPKWLDLAPDPDQPDRPSASGWYLGQTYAGWCPVCRGGRMDAFLERNCGLTGEDCTTTLQHFRPLPGKKDALEECRKLLAMNQNPAGFVTLHGAYGVGKSHLLKALVNGFRGIKVQARYASLADLLGAIREKFSDEHGVVAVEDAIDQYTSIPVLCIDEVADDRRASLTPWAKETTFRLLDRRYNKREECLTVLATNVHPDKMAPEWGYLRSRMDGGTVIEVQGEDMREYTDLLKQQRITGRPIPQAEPEPEYGSYPTAQVIGQMAERMDQ
jgi:DNA replication protein DnaC